MWPFFSLLLILQYFFVYIYNLVTYFIVMRPFFCLFSSTNPTFSHHRTNRRDCTGIPQFFFLYLVIALNQSHLPVEDWISSIKIIINRWQDEWTACPLTTKLGTTKTTISSYPLSSQ